MSARPASKSPGPPYAPRVEPARLVDPELDAAVARLARESTSALVHGDYYRGNLRCVGGHITALFDWDDARVWTLEYELAWSVWEFAQCDAAADLDRDRAAQFLGAYGRAGGPASLGTDQMVTLIRDGLRQELRHAAALAESGLSYDPDYIARAQAAFDALAGA